MCTHEPPCPGALTEDRACARVSVAHPEQGWNLLCNGVIVFDDDGLLLPGGAAIAGPARSVPAHLHSGSVTPLRSSWGELRPVA